VSGGKHMHTTIGGHDASASNLKARGRAFLRKGKKKEDVRCSEGRH
jgi:hypothetical protein